MTIAHLKTRSHIFQTVRQFFWERDFIEVETPVRIPAPAIESHIDVPSSERAWLRASPELHMKRLLVSGADRLFQIGPCFRSGECGQRHNPEFTLLEWYRTQADYSAILSDTVALLQQVVQRVTSTQRLVYQGQHLSFAQPWHQITVQEAYRQWAGWDPVTHWDPDHFDFDMVTCIEPNLPRDRPCVLTDYPAPAAALARLNPQNPAVAERWELYVGGLEIANAYTELCDPITQRQRFLEDAATRRKLGKADYPIDEPFLEALQQGMPPCGGIALGMDRLVMLLCDTPDIAEIRAFCQRPGELW